MTRAARPSLSFVLFVKDEEALLEPAVRRALSALERDFDDFEIVLVDDGSRDRTGEIMDRLATEDARVVVRHNLVNLNVGVSIQRGLAAARKEIAVYDGVDLPLDPEDVGGLADLMAGCDLLVLERTSFAGYTRWRRVTSEINRALLRLLFGAPFRDLNYSQVFRTDVLPRILPLAKSPAFTAPEMILRALRLGLRVTTTPVAYHARPVGTGSLGRPHDILWSVYDMVRFRSMVWRKLRRVAP
jgi:undecaprenyl-phosphate 4-deoxy-4-formamido-L-arabinose transferase